MDRFDSELARELGQLWAEDKAALVGDIPEWPEVWRREWLSELPERLRLREPVQRALFGRAHQAAAKRWAELLSEHRQ